MKSKRLISGLLALTFVFGGAVVPSNVVNNISIISASAGNQFISEQFFCTELDNGTVRIDSAKSDWRNLETAAVIPSEIDGKTVTSIASSAFKDCKFTSVEIPNTITNIAYNSFYGCKKLRSIVLPGSIEIIDGCAFQYCTSLESVTLNEGLGLIREYAFDNCKSLKSIEIPSSVRCIGDNAFNNCTNLAEIHISKGTQSLEIGKNAFCNCQSLTNVKIPSSVTRIDNCAFKNCTLLNYISLPDSLEFLGEYEVFNNCFSLMDVNIPKSLDVIPTNTFSNCTRLTNITIPDNIKEIGSAAFSGCTGLINIKIPDNIEKIGYSAFYGCTGLTNVFIPEGVTTIDKFAFGGCTGLKHIWIPSSAVIGPNAFATTTSNTNPLNNVTIYCFLNTYAHRYADENELHYKVIDEITTYPTNLRYGYNEKYRQVKITWDPVARAERYAIAVYISGKWRMQTQNIPASTTSYVTPKNSISPGSSYKIAVAARVNGEWDITNNAIKNALTIYIPVNPLDTNEDSDGDYLNDNIDPLPHIYNPITIEDENIDDSESISGNNPSLDSESNYLTDGKLCRASIGGGDAVKNAYRFTRRTGKDSFVFRLLPTKNSDYKITITNADRKNTNLKIQTINTTSGYNVSREYIANCAIYTLSLEKDQVYDIEIVNNSKICDYCEVTISQDNWVYAPKGGYCEYTADETYPPLIYSSLYIIDEYVYDMIKAYGNRNRWEDYEQYPATFEEYKTKALKNGIDYDEAKDLANDMFSLSQMSEETYKDIINTACSDIGNLASITGLLLAFTNPGGFICTAIGAGAVIGSIGTTPLYDRDDIKDIFYDGQLNICIDNCVIDLPGDPHKEENNDSVRYKAWEEMRYINKYPSSASNKRRWDKICIFTDIYEVEEASDNNYKLIAEK